MRDQTSSKNAIVTPCITRVKKSQSSTAPSSIGTKLNPGAVTRVQVPGDEAPQHDVDGHPGEQRQRRARGSRASGRTGGARWRATRRGPHGHQRPPSASGSRATVMNSSSSVSLPCSRGQGLRVAFEQDPAVREEQHAVADLLDLVHVVRGPQHAAACPAPRTRGSSRGCRAPSRDRARPSARRAAAAAARLSIALARPTRVCSPDESTPHFVSRKRPRSNCSSSASMRSASRLHAVEQAEDAQVLRDGQVAGQRRVHGGEVRPLERRGERSPREVHAFDADRAGARLEHAEDHVDGRRLARAVRPEQPDDLVPAHLERDPVHRHDVAVALAEPAHREHRLAGGGRAAHFPSTRFMYFSIASHEARSALASYASPSMPAWSAAGFVKPCFAPG